MAEFDDFWKAAEEAAAAVAKWPEWKKGTARYAVNGHSEPAPKVVNPCEYERGRRGYVYATTWRWCSSGPVSGEYVHWYGRGGIGFGDCTPTACEGKCV